MYRLSGKLLFADGNIREDRYIDTGYLDDFVIQWTCTDTKEDQEECQSHFAALYFRGDKPANFPWKKAVKAFENLGIESRDFIMYYANEGKNIFSFLAKLN